MANTKHNTLPLPSRNSKKNASTDNQHSTIITRVNMSTNKIIEDYPTKGKNSTPAKRKTKESPKKLKSYSKKCKEKSQKER